MKTFEKFICIVTFICFLPSSAKAEYIYFEGKWYWCPPEPVLAARVDVSDCIPIDEPSRDETNSGGDSGTTTPSTPDPGTGYVFIPPPLPYPDPGNSDIDYTGGDGGDETYADGEILNPGEVGGSPEPVLPPICRCNVCPCGGCILAEGESLPAGCEEKCNCPPPGVIDFSKASDEERITAILIAIKNNKCILSDLFINFPTVSYSSFPGGTNILLCNTNFKVIMFVGNFSDDFAQYGFQTPDPFENFNGCWAPINVGSNTILRILISCENNLNDFINCIFY